MKATAMNEAGNGDGNTSPGAAIGTALGTAFINQISVQPGGVMWVLMAVALLCIGIPQLARRPNLVVSFGE